MLTVLFMLMISGLGAVFSSEPAVYEVTFRLSVRPQSAHAAAVPSAEGETARVTRIVDGDTIDVLLDGQEFRLRYIGIDTPERGEACYDEAASYNGSLVAGKTVRLVKDISETDRFGRLLRYVWVGDTFVNLALVEHGYARATYYAPDGEHYDEFAAAQQRAVQRGCFGERESTQGGYDTTSTCAALKARSIVPQDGWPRGHPMYTSRRDGDDNGWACE